MDVTSHSLLAGAAGGDPVAANRLAEIYRPWIYGILVRARLQADDAEDLTQVVLLKLYEKLPGFEHNGHPGAFRRWLTTIAVNAAREFYRKRATRPGGCGGSDWLREVEHLEDSEDAAGRDAEREYAAAVVHGLLRRAEAEGHFAPSTISAFRLTQLEQIPVAGVAEDLGLTPAAVHAACSRVLRHLREAAAGLLDDL